MIRAILFDKDGTLTDFRATWEAWLSAMIADLSQESDARSEDIAAVLGFDLEAGRIQSDGPFVTAPKARTAAALRPLTGWSLEYLVAWISEREARAEQVPVTPIPAFLSGLRDRGFTLGVLTNADQAEARDHLDRFGATPFLHRIIGCDDGFGAKPDPRGAASFADDLGLSRDEVVMVGDGIPDMAAARGAGLRAVGVLTGTLTEAELSRMADAVLRDITHLPDWLDRAG